MESGFFALLARGRYIRRWGLMRSTNEENISEHSYMTALLAHSLAVIRRDVFGGEADPDRCAAVALFHDASEIITGDLPTPVKYANPEILDAYKKIEGLASERLGALLPEELRPAYEDVLGEGEGGVRELVKAADKLAAYIKCVEELEAGNGEFRSAAKQTRAALDALGLPEIDYFIKTFMPAFGMTLDEITAMGDKK
ncbi:MAG: 5'-deoxynucleotidase [Oscillospiraceae bacterium]|jgi:5'-deoxynucleotidase|nr:5'-deoxynucleotidase [Oscillospiraceae bacterium]